MLPPFSSWPKIIFIFIMLTTGTSYAQSFIPFTVTPQGHILIKAKINGVEGNFIFDTGAGLNLITKAFSEKIKNLHKQDGSYTAFRATGEQLTAELYDAQTLTLGNYKEENPVLTIFDANLGSVDGLISLMSFREQPFTIDYSNKKIVFETQKSTSAIRKLGYRVPLQLEDSRGVALTVFTYFTVNNELTLQFCIDSGAGSNIFRINSKYIIPFAIDTANATKIAIPSEFNPNLKTIIYQANVKSINSKASPDVNCSDVKVSFIDGLIYDGILSLNWIGKQITFDLKKREMIVVR